MTAASVETGDWRYDSQSIECFQSYQLAALVLCSVTSRNFLVNLRLGPRDVWADTGPQIIMHRWLGGHEVLDQHSDGQSQYPHHPAYNHITVTSSKSNSYHGDPHIPADVFNVSNQPELGGNISYVSRTEMYDRMT